MSNNYRYNEVGMTLPAFCKLVLHCTKYPQHPVNGVLIRKKGTKELICHDTLPLLHMSKYVTPIMESALSQVDNYCQIMKHEIVGYYQANVGLGETSPDFVMQRIAEKLSDANRDIFTVMVNNSQLDSNLESIPFDVYTLQEGKLKLTRLGWELQPGKRDALSIVSALIQLKAYRYLVDFDNHLDDVKNCWWDNKVINKKIVEVWE